jgi:hypothetical protein
VGRKKRENFKGIGMQSKGRSKVEEEVLQNAGYQNIAGEKKSFWRRRESTFF